MKQGDSEGQYWVPAMSDAPLRGYNGRHEWFWEPGDEEHIFPVENLVDMYYKSVGRNSTLILGLTPDPTGLMPEPDVQRLREFGDEIKKRFSTPLAATSGRGTKVDIKLAKSQRMNQLVIQEDIVEGERIREYKVEALVDGKWKTVASGQSIGHKWIHMIEEVTTQRLRLVVNKSIAEPIIKTFSVYNVNQN